jgi:leucyl aminopeptidase
MLTSKTFSLLWMGLASFSIAYAEPALHIIVAPHCLIKKIDQNIDQKINNHYKTLASYNHLSLIETNDDGIEQFIAAKHSQPNRCGGFMDVTNNWNDFNIRFHHQANTFLKKYALSSTSSSVTPSKANYGIHYRTEVNQIVSQMNSQRMWNNLTALTAFSDRYSRSDNGVKAAEWIRDQVKFIAGDRTDVSIYFIPTGSYKQPSVVAKLGHSSEPGIVIGGHLDTTSGVKPGADDDGTGSVTVLEVAHTLISSGMHFKKPIYFIWYAAEEMGLVGSQYVVKEFKNKNISISEVMQLDMTGYPDKDYPTAIWLMDDNVSTPLTTYLETLTNAYVNKPIKHDRCGYACSDHATWTQNGISAAIPFEAAMNHYNPYIHSSRDTMEKLVLTHMLDYTKLALAFAVELAEPVAG